MKHITDFGEDIFCKAPKTIEEYRTGKSQKIRIREAKVTKILYGQLAGMVEVVTLKSKTYMFYWDSFQKKTPLKVGDSLSCSKAIYYPQFEFIEGQIRPLVFISTNVQSFKRIIKSLTKFEDLKIHNLYSQIEAKVEANAKTSGFYESVHDFMSKMSNLYIKNPSEVKIGILEKMSYYNHVSKQTSPMFTKEQLDKVMKGWINMYDRRQLLVLGLTSSEIENAERIYQCSADLLYRKIITNPYCVASIEFSKCMSIAQCSDYKPDKNDIACYNIARKIYDNSVTRGYTCTRYEQLNKASNMHLFLHRKKLTEEYGVIFDRLPVYPSKDPIMPGFAMSITNYTEEFVYLTYFHKVEVDICNSIRKRVIDEPYLKLPKGIIYDPKLDDDQRLAVKTSLSMNFSILTGPAGSGKSTTIKSITDTLDLNKIKYAVTSFTGKAVQRAKQLNGLGDRAATFHRMIYGRARNMEFDVLLVDEATMTDARLLHSFFEMYDKDYPIIFVGDVNQLPPIGWGSVFFSCMNSRSVPRTVLKNIHRVKTLEGETDGIIANSSSMVTWPVGQPFIFDTSADNVTIEKSGPLGIEAIIKDYKAKGYRSEDITVICPYKRGHGIQYIQKICQTVWNYDVNNPDSRVTTPDGREWMIGDKVMMLINNYDIDVFNGQEGKIVAINHDEEGNKYLVVKFSYTEYVDVDRNKELVQNDICEVRVSSAEDMGNGKVKVRFDKFVNIELSETKNNEEVRLGDKGGEESIQREDFVTTDDIGLSYCLTTHKSQGSEWKIVIFYMPDSCVLRKGGFITRQIIYTSWTRASERMHLIGSELNACMGLSFDLPYRCEMLCDRLKACLPRQYNYEEYKFNRRFDQSDQVDDLRGYNGGDDEDWECEAWSE